MANIELLVLQNGRFNQHYARSRISDYPWMYGGRYWQRDLHSDIFYLFKCIKIIYNYNRIIWFRLSEQSKVYVHTDLYSFWNIPWILSNCSIVMCKYKILGISVCWYYRSSSCTNLIDYTTDVSHDARGLNASRCCCCWFGTIVILYMCSKFV